MFSASVQQSHSWCVIFAWYAEKVDIQRMNALRWIGRQVTGRAGGLLASKKKGQHKVLSNGTGTDLSATDVDYVYDPEKQARRRSDFSWRKGV